MPGAYFDANNTHALTIKTGEWMNCTTMEQMEPIINSWLKLFNSDETIRAYTHDINIFKQYIH